jgi:rubredoxin
MRQKKGKFSCEVCGYRDDSQTFLMFTHTRQYHPGRWIEIQAELEGERNREKMKSMQPLEDEESIKCPRCGGGGKLFINEKGQERIPGEDYVETE